jgi:transposase
MAKPLLTDDVWRDVEPLLPRPHAVPRRGRPRLSDRACLTGILFVLKTGIAWEHLPCEAGCGSGMTCWRRLRQWQRLGTWPVLQHTLVQRLEDGDRIDWQRANHEYPERSARSRRTDRESDHQTVTPAAHHDHWRVANA